MLRSLTILMGALLLAAPLSVYAYTIDGVAVERSLKERQVREKAVQQVSELALAQLLKELTARRDWGRHASIIQAANVDQLVGQVAVVEERTEQGQYHLVANVQFDEARVKDLLTRLQIPFQTQVVAPAVLVPIWQQGGEARVWDATNAWHQTLEQQSDAVRKVSVASPTVDLLTQWPLARLRQMDTTSRGLLLQQFGAQRVVLAEARQQTGWQGLPVMNVRGQLITPNGVTTIFEQLYTQPEMRLIADDMIRAVQRQHQVSELVPVDQPGRLFVRYQPESVWQLQQTQQRLEKAPLVRAIKPKLIAQQDVVWQVDYFGEPAQLQQRWQKVGLSLLPLGNLYQLQVTDVQ